MLGQQPPNTPDHDITRHRLKLPRAAMADLFPLHKILELQTQYDIAFMYSKKGSVVTIRGEAAKVSACRKCVEHQLMCWHKTQGGGPAPDDSGSLNPR